MQIQIKLDGTGYLAEVIGYDNIFAYGNTEIEAKKELLIVIDMMIEQHQEEINKEKQIKEMLLTI